MGNPNFSGQEELTTKVGNSIREDGGDELLRKAFDSETAIGEICKRNFTGWILDGDYKGTDYNYEALLRNVPETEFLSGRPTHVRVEWASESMMQRRNVSGGMDIDCDKVGTQ